MIMRLMRTLLALAVALVLMFAYGLPLGLPSMSMALAGDISPPGGALVNLSTMGQERTLNLKYLYADKDSMTRSSLEPATVLLV